MNFGSAFEQLSIRSGVCLWSNTRDSERRYAALVRVYLGCARETYPLCSFSHAQAFTCVYSKWHRRVHAQIYIPHTHRYMRAHAVYTRKRSQKDTPTQINERAHAGMQQSSAAFFMSNKYFFVCARPLAFCRASLPSHTCSDSSTDADMDANAAASRSKTEILLAVTIAGDRKVVVGDGCTCALVRDR